MQNKSVISFFNCEFDMLTFFDALFVEMTAIANSAEPNGQHESHYQPLDHRYETTTQQETQYCNYENTIELSKQRYQVPKPVSMVRILSNHIT